MSIFVDKNNFNLEKTARRVLAHMGIQNDKLLFFYDNMSRARSGGEAVFFPTRHVYFGEGSFGQMKAREMLAVNGDWQHAIYFDRRACVQSLNSEIENISYHAHELRHYQQYRNERATWSWAQRFWSAYRRMKGLGRVMDYENNPLERDAVFSEKRIVSEFVDPLDYKVHLLWKADSVDGSLATALNQIDIKRPYNLKDETWKMIQKYEHIMPRGDDPPMTSTDESDFDQL